MSEEQLQGSGESKVSTEFTPWTVSNFTASLKEWITKLGNVWVEGQLSQISPKKDVFFGELRDLVVDKGFSIHSRRPLVLEQIAQLSQGDRVVVLVHPDFWERSGKTSMDVLAIRKVGLGELLERIERLRQQLIAEGLTAAEKKLPLPYLPNLIGLVTGANSDAEKDVVENSRRRWPEVKFRIEHTPVQGDKAAPEIVKAIQLLDKDPEVDVIILARGGGSFQDLLVFSDESVVRAVANCETPIVSAIGHENDRPLTDDVADLRASTPTDAAKRVVPDVILERQNLASATERIRMRLWSFLEAQAEILKGLKSRPIFVNPYTLVEDRRIQLAQTKLQLDVQVRNLLDREVLLVGQLRRQVLSLSPKQTLDRGYAVVRDDSGHLITSPKQTKKGDALRITLAGGDISATTN